MLKLAAARIPLEYYRDRYTGYKAVVVGSGPTNFDYNQLLKISDPIFFINDALFAISKHTTEHFIFTWHQDIKRFWDSNAIYVMGTGLVGHARPRNYVWLNFISDLSLGTKHQIFPKWTLDKKFITNKQQMIASHGSISGLIHFIWYCGFSDILGIGINPCTKHMQMHDTRLQPAVEGTSRYDHIILTQESYFRHFNLQCTYYENLERGKNDNCRGYRQVQM